MGEAKQRGSFEDRRDNAAKTEVAEEAEALVFLKAKEGVLNVQILPRDDEPDQTSPAIIFAAFLNTNMKALIDAAFVAYRTKDDPDAGQSLKLISPRGGWVN